MSELSLFRGTPLDSDLPTDPTQRIHRYARDLAWGAVRALWTPRMVVSGNHIEFSRRQDQANYQTYMLVWDRQEPSIHLLTAFGYLQQQPEGQIMSGLLTQEAFKLLQAPINEPSIFISYRRTDSTALALLIEARLRMAGNRDVFVDKLLEIGGEWQRELDDRIRASAFFIVLIGPDTFESEWVNREIEVAHEAGCTIIPMWQADVERDDNTPQIINQRQEIRIERETADGYETAINKLLNRLGYSTY